jgi:Cu+-exporting ATPase
MEKVDTRRRQDRHADRRPACRHPGRAGARLRRSRVAASCRLGRAGVRASARVGIVEAAKDRGIVTSDVIDFDSPTGRGALGTVEGRRIVLGNAQFLADEGVATDALASQADALRRDGATAIFIGVDGTVGGAFAIADPVKATTPEALAALKAEGIRVVMLTGDNRTTAEAVARRLGIDEVEAEVLPDQKSAVVARFKREAGRRHGRRRCQRRPALAAADVGIAMGSGTDVAIESAGVTLLKGDLTGIVRARRLSQATMSNIRQNLVFAFIYNVAGVPVAAGALYPLFGILLAHYRGGGDGALFGERGHQRAAPQPESTVNIGETSRQSGVSERMIRHYEKIGLIPAPARRGAGYRDYGERDLHRLRFIANARDLGFPIEEIRTLLSLWANTGRASAEVKRLALARADEFQRKAEALTALRDTLIDLAERCQGDERPDCPIIAELAAARSA